MHVASNAGARPPGELRVLRMLRFWVAWRIARILLPLLLAFVLLTELTSQIHRQPPVRVQGQFSGLVRHLDRETHHMILGARHAVTDALLGKARR
jgi:hypothetical protein